MLASWCPAKLEIKIGDQALEGRSSSTPIALEVNGGRGLKTIKILVALILTLVLVLTGVVYAAPFSSSSVKAIGGTGYQFVTAPSSSPLGIAWRITDGQVDGVNIIWTPDIDGTFEIEVEINESSPEATGKVTVSGTKSVQQTNLVPVSPAIAPVDILTVAIAIVED